MNTDLAILNDLPGADIVISGISDIAAKRVTPHACLVSMAAPHLIRAGVDLCDVENFIPEPERTLYRLLSSDGTACDPYPRYNALKRRIVSFARGLASRQGSVRAESEV